MRASHGDRGAEQKGEGRQSAAHRAASRVGPQLDGQVLQYCGVVRHLVAGEPGVLLVAQLEAEQQVVEPLRDGPLQDLPRVAGIPREWVRLPVVEVRARVEAEAKDHARVGSRGEAQQPTPVRLVQAVPVGRRRRANGAAKGVGQEVVARAAEAQVGVAGRLSTSQRRRLASELGAVGAGSREVAPEETAILRGINVPADVSTAGRTELVAHCDSVLWRLLKPNRSQDGEAEGSERQHRCCRRRRRPPPQHSLRESPVLFMGAVLAPRCRRCWGGKI